MFNHKNIARNIFRNLCLFAFTLILTGCISGVYVDPAVKEIPTSEFKQPAESKKQPVQVIFNFQTNGKPNSQATKLLKEQVIEQVKTSGLFSETTEQNSKDIAILNIALNNVVSKDEINKAVGKGVLTGLTFGLVGAGASDTYICTIDYLPANGTTPITKTSAHAIHVTFGLANAPVDVPREQSITSGVQKMTREIISNALHQLSIDEQFATEE